MPDASPRSFISRLQPAPVGGGFAMDDYWVWCGSAVEGEDGLWHMFAARWPRRLPFFEGYLTHSEVVHAVSPTPCGPYTFRDIALPPRGEKFWDGQMTHNPTIHKSGDTYLLFYIGTTYPGPQLPIPEPGTEAHRLHKSPAGTYDRIRIGMATSKSLNGPWERSDRPVFQPDAPGKWDGSIVTNPAPCVRGDGKILLIYRANAPGGLRLGVALADDFRSPFRRLLDEPIPTFTDDFHVEDPFVWWEKDHYEMLAKDLRGKITGEIYSGAHAYSADGIDWKLFDAPQAYSRTVRWDDGTVTYQGALERPSLLFHRGKPVCLLAATGDGPGGFNHCTRTWNIAIPIAPD